MPQQSTPAQLYSRGASRIMAGSRLFWAGIGDWFKAAGLVAAKCFVLPVVWLLTSLTYVLRLVARWTSLCFTWVAGQVQYFFHLIIRSVFWQSFVALARRVLHWFAIAFLVATVVLAFGLFCLAVYYLAPIEGLSVSTAIMTLASVLLFVGLGFFLLSKTGIWLERGGKTLKRVKGHLRVLGDRGVCLLNIITLAFVVWISKSIRAVYRSFAIAFRIASARWKSIRDELGLIVRRFWQKPVFSTSRQSAEPLSTSKSPSSIERPRVERETDSDRPKEHLDQESPRESVSLLNLFSASWVDIFGFTMLFSVAVVSLALFARSADKSVIQLGPVEPEKPSVYSEHSWSPNLLKPVGRVLLGSAYTLGRSTNSGPFLIASVGDYLVSKWSFDVPSYEGPVLTPLLNEQISWRKESSLVFEQDGQPIHYLSQITLDSAALCSSKYIFVVGLASRGGPSQLNAALSKARAAQLAVVVERLSLYCENSPTPTIVAMSSSEAYQGASDVQERSLLAFGAPWLPDAGWDPQKETRDRILDQFEWQKSSTGGLNSMCIYRGNDAVLTTRSIPSCDLNPDNDWPLW